MSSFQFPVGEVTITLDDVSSLLHLPVVGDLHAFQPLHMDDAVQMLVDLLMVYAEAARAEIGQCRGSYICLEWVCDIYECRCRAGHWTAAACAYLLHLLCCTLFANKSATNVHLVFLEAHCDLSQTGRYAWGVAALVHMYDHLNDASISTNRQLGGYITLLQCWIYEHFPSVAESTADPEYDENSPRACSLLRLGLLAVYYLPERVMRQFGYTQTILALPVDSWVSYDDIHDRWMHYLNHMVAPGEATDPLPDGHAPYPRVVPQVPQTDIPHVSEPGAPSTSAMPVVDEPRHAVEVCYEIAERLERHLSLGVVTPGSSTHEVIEDCLRIARSVTQDQLVYVRSRRRRCTDQA
ncbi:Protein MAIN-LIKE 1 [Glycine soja]